jgi:hypothetical protein
MLSQEPEMLRTVKDLVREYQDVFSSPEQAIGKTNLIEFSLELEPGARLQKARVCPLNPRQKQSLKDQLDLWKDEDVIEECESPWASALVPVLKKDNTKDGPLTTQV